MCFLKQPELHPPLSSPSGLRQGHHPPLLDLDVTLDAIRRGGPSEPHPGEPLLTMPAGEHKRHTSTVRSTAPTSVNMPPAGGGYGFLHRSSFQYFSKTPAIILADWVPCLRPIKGAPATVLRGHL